MKRTPLNAVSPQRAIKRANSRDEFRDCHGVAFDEVQSLLGPVRAWPRIKRVDGRDVIVRVQRTFVNCFWCNERGDWHSQARHLQLDPHHIFGGSAGRSDELTNILPVHRPCHDLIQSDSKLLGRVLYRKWLLDRMCTNWVRLSLLFGRFLPDLITE